MDKTYNPKKYEEKIYKFWEEGGFFTPKIDKAQKPFVITLPLPNVTSRLHLGNAMFTLEDIMIRYHRMKGEPTLWVPGLDHAAIALQNVVEKKLAKKGKTRHDLGREKFYQLCVKTAERYGKRINKQLRTMGFSLDWTRSAYTLDEIRNRAVMEAFVRFFKKGLIYKGKRIINWCPRCATALSDLEVDYQEEKTELYFLNYGSISIATTRPETIFADVAVAVHPKDKRYQRIIGKMALLPLINRELPIIADSAVDPEFGTGALKITPAHDELDFEIGKRHNLYPIAVIGTDGKMTARAGKYAGVTVSQARREIIEDLKKAGVIEKVKSYTHAIGVCQRCETTVEPLISSQWFVRIAPLAKEALEVVKAGKIKIIPKRFEKIYFNWMENIHDWCISRQLWWGHRIPIFYCQGMENEKCKREKGVFSVVSKPEKCPYCQSKEITQEDDVLDTWFSSGIWPISTMGWPEKTEDFSYFYPNTVRETGYDILFFWVAREIMMCTFLTGKVPFRIVYLHGLVRDKYGRKMSKSEGNILDPLDLTQKYGTDALRMALVAGTSPGKDMVVSEEKIQGYRNFANKIWNAARFVIGESGNREVGKPGTNKPDHPITRSPDHPEDQWIIKELNKTVKSVTRSLKDYKFSQAGEALYAFFWHKFCDKYLESTKKRRREAQPTLVKVLEISLYLLHPFMPYITEVIWQKMKEENSLPKEASKYKSITVALWPKAVTTQVLPFERTIV